MKIYELDVSNHNDFNENDLLNYLSETVLSMIDDEIKSLKDKLKDTTKSLYNINEEFKTVKIVYKKMISDLAKEKQLKRVLTRIETLNKEGSLRGNRKTQIIKYLANINEFSFAKLSQLEESLSVW